MTLHGLKPRRPVLVLLCISFFVALGFVFTTVRLRLAPRIYDLTFWRAVAYIPMRSGVMVPRPFDPVIWKRDTRTCVAARGKSSASRDQMLGDLLKRHTLIQMPRDQVVALLGPPDSISPQFYPEWDLKYWLGPQRDWFGGDDLWLLLKLDTNGIVTKFWKACE